MIVGFTGCLFLLIAASGATVAAPASAPATAPATVPASGAAACAIIPTDTRIRGIGTFSNMRTTEEHAYGYDVSLWAAGDCLVGFFDSSQGLIGDTPTGSLENVRHDRGSGRLTFTAKLSMGTVRIPGSQDLQRSQDLFTFDGILKQDRIVGTVTHSQPNAPRVVPVREEVVLRRLKDEDGPPQGPGTYGAWEEYWQPVLKFRGPGW